VYPSCNVIYDLFFDSGLKLFMGVIVIVFLKKFYFKTHHNNIFLFFKKLFLTLTYQLYENIKKY
jgi:hypothetical protein